MGMEKIDFFWYLKNNCLVSPDWFCAGAGVFIWIERFCVRNA